MPLNVCCLRDLRGLPSAVYDSMSDGSRISRINAAADTMTGFVQPSHANSGKLMYRCAKYIGPAARQVDKYYRSTIHNVYRKLTT